MNQQSLAMIKRLVGFDTVSRNSNLVLIDYVREYLFGLGVDSHLVKNADGKKANLFATLGPNVEDGIVLSGHTDVVPVDGQAWSTDPFTVTARNGRLYGRGTCDMKSFLAVSLAKAPDMLAANLQHPVHFALSYDEETGCVGAPAMIDQMAKKIARPRAVIVGEPSNMTPFMAHKGLAVVRTTVIGHEVHSSQIHRGVSAVMTAAQLIQFLSELMAANKAQADPASMFEPPYSTLHVGMVKGGTAVNIISRECSFTWDIRALPGDRARNYVERLEEYSATLLPALKAIAPEISITTEVLADSPAMSGEGTDAAQHFAQHLTGCSCCGVAPYATEGGLFQERGFPAVICGPGSIDQAHQPNEYIEVSQIEQCENFMDKMIGQLS